MKINLPNITGKAPAPSSEKPAPHQVKVNIQLPQAKPIEAKPATPPAVTVKLPTVGKPATPTVKLPQTTATPAVSQQAKPLLNSVHQDIPVSQFCAELATLLDWLFSELRAGMTSGKYSGWADAVAHTGEVLQKLQLEETSAVFKVLVDKMMDNEALQSWASQHKSTGESK